MKDIIAKDSTRILVFDDKVKQRGLFSYYFKRIAAYSILGALAVYGLLSFNWNEVVNEIIKWMLR